MRVRQDGDSRGVGEPPQLSVQVLRLAPPGCSRLLPIHVYVLSLKEKKICAVLGSPERVSKKEGDIPIAGVGGGGAERAGGSSLFHLAREFSGLAS